MPPEPSRFVTIDGCQLEYEWHGPAAGDAPTIVFLHEGLGAITLWRDFPASLCARLGWGGLVYNRRGYGHSGAVDAPFTPRFMHWEALEVLPRVLDRFEITEPILFGHSDGGSIALLYAASGLRPPRALILEAPHVFVEDVTVASIRALRDQYRSTDLRARLERHHGANVDTLFEAWTTIWLSDSFRDWHITAALGGVGVVKFGREMKFGGVIPSGFSLQQNAGPVALKAIKMFRPQKFRGFTRVF